MQDLILPYADIVQNLHRKNTQPPQNWPVMSLSVQDVIEAIERVEPGQGRIKTLAILYLLDDADAYVSPAKTAQRLVVADKTRLFWRKGVPPKALSNQFRVPLRSVYKIVSKK